MQNKVFAHLFEVQPILNFQHASLDDIQKNIRELEIDDNRKKELACALHAQFKDWLYGKLHVLIQL
jgi:hypothetical protein